MKYIFLFFSMFFYSCISTLALDKEHIDSIKNSHFTLSGIHDLWYETIKVQSIGSRNFYELESSENCTISIQTSTVSRNMSDSERGYLIEKWLIDKQTKYKAKWKWNITRESNWMRKIFSHTNGIEIVSEWYPPTTCHKKASRLVEKIIPNTQDAVETNIFTPIGTVRSTYDSSRYIIGADMISIFLIDISWEFTWVISEDAQYWLPWVLLKDDLLNGKKIDWFAWSGMVYMDGREIIYITLASMENAKESFSTFYIFPDEEIVWIIISSITNNPVRNLQSVTSVIDLQKYKKENRAQISLPTIQEILEANMWKNETLVFSGD